MVNFVREMVLLRELKDIRVELHIIGVLLQDQKHVVGAAGQYLQFEAIRIQSLQQLYDETCAMDKQAEITMEAVRVSPCNTPT